MVESRYLYGKDSSSILRADMNVTERTLKAEKMFAQFYKALDQEDYALAEKIIEEMDAQLSDDPKIVECRTQLEFSRM